jgi:fluoroquinolone transport system permease protein
MKRVLASLRWETTLQHRHGFYYVSALVVAIMAGLLTQVPAAAIPNLMPAFFVNALFITTFYFFAALVLLEKGEGTLEGLVVTPLRATEYITVKVAALAALALFENLLILIIGYGVGFNPLWLVAGLLAMAIIYALVGFIAVARFDSINEFILPSIGVLLLLALPVIDHFGLWRSAVWYLHPVQPSLVLMRAAFDPVPTRQLGYGLLGSSFWCLLFFWWARQLFARFIVRTAGSS